MASKPRQGDWVMLYYDDEPGQYLIGQVVCQEDYDTRTPGYRIREVLCVGKDMQERATHQPGRWPMMRCINIEVIAHDSI